MYKEILYLFPNATLLDDFSLQDDGGGVYIKEWNEIKLGPQPTTEQLTAVSVLANTKTQTQLDYERYFKRSQARDKILAEFATENMGRIRAGTWTVPNLVALTQDAQLTTLLSNINTLSFELAIGTVQGLTNPLITSEIKSSWVSKLQANLYL